MSYMMDRLEERYKKEVSDDPTLVKMMTDKCNTFLTASEIPNVYLLDRELDMSKINRKTIDFINNISNIFFSSASIGIWVSTYESVGYFLAKAMEEHIYDKCVKDEYPGNILYIDTPLLLSDMKKLINRDENFTSPRLNFSLDVIYHKVYDADFIIWNRFNVSESSNYDVNKLFEILLHRYNNCKGNAFVLCGLTPADAIAKFHQDTLTVMNCKDHFYNFSDVEFPLIENIETSEEENKVDGQ